MIHTPMRLVVALMNAVAVFACTSHPIVTEDQAPLGVRNAHGLVYDEALDETVLFGGADEQAVLDETWSWNGRKWQRAAASGPSPRTFPALTYDSVRRRVMLFGGNRVLFGSGRDRDTCLGDLWAYDGNRWVAVPASGPAARAEAAMAFDRRRGRLVLFGGHACRTNGEGEMIRFGDTWEWDGSSWRQRGGAGPSPRSGVAMVYDERRDRIVLFGGSGASSETWEWDGDRWTGLDVDAGPGRFNPAMTRDTMRDLVLRFGGWDGRRRVGDTWSYDGAR